MSSTCFVYEIRAAAAETFSLETKFFQLLMWCGVVWCGVVCTCASQHQSIKQQSQIMNGCPDKHLENVKSTPGRPQRRITCSSEEVARFCSSVAKLHQCLQVNSNSGPTMQRSATSAESTQTNQLTKLLLRSTIALLWSVRDEQRVNRSHSIASWV